MIKVENLTKQFVGRNAIEDISFEVAKGEIVGFLGPNGAGKTTTLRILTSFLPPTAGRASVAGHDVFTQSIKTRRCIGYMPENVPLYPDMRVKEYLKFRAALKGIRGRKIEHAVSEVIEICGLTEVRRRMIHTLSKGFRQRVGLADALAHRPELLILDEPTNGLDPNQIRQVRTLIRQLGEKHTILLSTHILPEVEMTCGRVIIIDRGKIKASDTPGNLIKRLRTAGTVKVEIKADAGTAAQKIRQIPGVKKVRADSRAREWSHLTVRVESNSDVREAINEVAVKMKWPLRELCRQEASLEDVFVELTQGDGG